ncbi:MAG: branched-chain amino acid ABC transporter permease [Ancalomicrobiaceae bacterium]|nr:branched-chain amino acid ABC transporter permease [Ancalomicrobiaceae bacterium]
MNQHILILVLNGLTQGALFFVLGSGLTLAFGLMRIVNMSHGAFYLLGGYMGLTVLRLTGNWTVALVAAGLSIALLGLLVERGLLARIRAGGDLSQTLLTIALSMIIADMALAVWGGHTQSIRSPAALSGPVTVFGFTYPGFRYVLMAISAAIAFGLWLLLYRTRFGIAVRASVDDRETVSALGVRIDIIYSLMFMLSAFLSGIAGVLGGTYLQLSPGEDTTILTYSLVVVIVGGLGSLMGVVVSSLILGQILSFSLAFAPQMSMFLVFVPMAIVLAVRPEGLFGRRL